MSIKVEVDTSDLNKIFESVQKLAPYIHGKKGYPKNLVRNAARAMTKLVEDEAKNTAPRSGLLGRTSSTGQSVGPLRSSIVKKILSARYRYDVKGVNSREYYYVSSNVRKYRTYYMTPLELGWRKPDGRSYEGAHFLKKAVKSKSKQAQELFKRKLAKDIERVANKINRENPPT